MIPAFQKLSSAIGKERVIWRYDPILLNERYTILWHKSNFRALCNQLAAYTEKCTISFLDVYQKNLRRMEQLGVRSLTLGEIEELVGFFSEAAKEYNLYLDTCAETIDLGKYGIGHAKCIDQQLLERIGNYHLKIKRDPNQRAVCGCAASIDLGAYNTCKNGCVYCYANFNEKLVADCCAKHNPNAPLLYGTISESDNIRRKEMYSLQVTNG